MDEPGARLDVIIPCADKDVETLPACIAGARRHVPEAGRVLVVSSRPLSADAEWLPEDGYPFSLADVQRLLPSAGARAGWYLQQLLKLYAPSVLPGATDRVLLLDADTVFLRRCPVLGDDGLPLYAVGSEHHTPYFEHMARLLPGLRRMAPVSGIVHHMVVDRAVLGALFREVEEVHQKPFWQAFLEEVAPGHAGGSGASEYEIYFNYRQWRHPAQGRLRPLAWANVPSLVGVRGLDFASAHAWMRR